MLSLAAISMLATSAPVLLHSFEKKYEWSRAHVAVTGLSSDGMISGFYCDFVGHHGETFAAKPFVIQARKLIWLPLGKSEYGKVFLSQSGRAVGQVISAGPGDHPASWTPDPRTGWKGAKLKVLKEQGYAVFLGNDGTLWFQNEEPPDALYAHLNGKTRLVLKEKFELVHVDKDGALYGNRYTGVMFGGRSHDPQGAIFRNRKWESMPRGFALSRVSASGDLLGYTREPAYRPALLEDGKVRLLPLSNKATYATAYPIVDANLIGGSVYEAGVTKACLWKKGKYEDLTPRLPASKDSQVVALELRQAIVRVEDEKAIRLYSLGVP